jgi:FecR protein
MKNKLVHIYRFGILSLTLFSALSLNAFAQTTEEGSGPSEQPSAPMEIGQEQPSDSPAIDATSPDANNPSDMEASNAQPTEAQPGGPSGEAPAATDQGVARVSLIHGDVSTQRGDSGDWSAVTLNQPVMTGDKISTANDARTELQLDFANTLRLGPNAKATIANLTHKNIQIQVGEGIATYVVSKDSESEPEIDTPNVSVHPSHHDGIFRVEVRPDGDTIVIVRQGEAQIATPQGSTEVRAGDMATVRGDANSAQYKISSAPDRDDWDRWNSDRDHLIRDANSWRHTNRRYTGTQDLDAYGRWDKVQDYGDVWVPNEPDGWVPYRDGNWTYQPYYGWTWVGYEPWGWAPYHYGRWFPYGNSWAWWPGPVWAGYNPFWSPAYVSFWGWGGGFGFGFGYGGWGGFGWLPIGPCDFFHPWWGGYRGRFGVVNINNIRVTNINRYGGIGPLHRGNRYSNINNIHNDHVLRAMSTVNANRFGAGRVRAIAATRQQLSGARMMAGNLPVVPSRASLSASGRAAAPSTIRNGGSQRFFGTRNNTARPVSFQQQTASLRQSMQQSRVGAVPAGGRDSTEFSARGGNSMQRPSAGIQQNRGVNNSGTRNNAAQGSSAQNGNRDGFRQFNPPTNNRAGGTSGTQSPRGTGNQPGGFRQFNPPTSNTRPNEMNNGSPARSNQSAPAENRGGFRPFTPPQTNNTRSSEFGNTGANRPQPQRSTVQNSPSENRGGFRPFSPPSSSGVSRGESGANYSRGGNTNYWNRTAPSSVSPRGYGSSQNGYGGGASRPQLDMRQPIVRGPSYGGGNSRGGYSSAPPSYGGSRGSPSYSAPRSAPSYGGGGSHSAPSYGGGGGGGGRAPSGGGGHPSGGGGGGHTSSGGGGHSSSGRR